MQAELVVEPLPELVNSERWEGTVQALGMIFLGDGTLTEEDIRKIVAGSAYDVEIRKDFGSDGNISISSLYLDGEYLIGFNKSGDHYVPHSSAGDYVPHLHDQPVSVGMDRK